MSNINCYFQTLVEIKNLPELTLKDEILHSLHVHQKKINYTINTFHLSAIKGLMSYENYYSHPYNQLINRILIRKIIDSYNGHVIF
jgi:hypothetical protein